MNSIVFKVLPLVFIFFCLSQLKAFGQTADIILTNGKIFTSDTRQLYVEAIAIKGNKILAVGSNQFISKLSTANTRKIDLQGKTVVPGFNNAHDHPGWGAAIGERYFYKEMNPAGPAKAAVLDSIGRLVKLAKPNEWISGFIGNSILFDTSMRYSLDSIAPNNPVVLQIWWGHGQVVNAKALAFVGLSDNDRDPMGGWYTRNASHQIAALQENAEAPFWFAPGQSDPVGLIKGMREYANEQLRGGITSVQFMSTGFSASEAVQVLQQARLPQRIRLIAWPVTTDHGRKLGEWNMKNSRPTPLTSISGIKYIIDGTPLEGNSLMKKPYTAGSNQYGRLNYPVDTMRQILKEAMNSNRQLMMHITGDSSFALVLSMMKELAGDEVWKKKRVRIEHNETSHITASEIEKVKELGLLMMHTPKYCMNSPVRSLMEKGIIVGIAPDGTTNPFYDIMVITSQQTRPNENITREQAVIAYTKTNAYAEFKENEKGTLAKGMLADLAVLSKDIFTIPVPQLPSIKSVLTIVDGKIVYQNNENSDEEMQGKKGTQNARIKNKIP